MSNKQYFIGLCINVGIYKCIPLKFIVYNLDYILMYMCMSAMYCVCMHTFHSAQIELYTIV